MSRISPKPLRLVIKSLLNVFFVRFFLVVSSPICSLSTIFVHCFEFGEFNRSVPSKECGSSFYVFSQATPFASPFQCSLMAFQRDVLPVGSRVFPNSIFLAGSRLVTISLFSKKQQRENVCHEIPFVCISSQPTLDEEEYPEAVKICRFFREAHFF